MRSRAEWALRALSLSALMLLAWRSVGQSDTPAPALAVRGDLHASLAAATRREVATLDVELEAMPGPVERDWLAAVHGAGTSVAWRASGVTPTAIAAIRVPEPEGRARISVAARDSAHFVLSDDLGVIDTVDVYDGRASRVVRTLTGAITAEERGSRAVTTDPPGIAVKRVLVIGSAGWESKFAITALEEAGWTVDARIRVAPGVETRQGADLPMDTARYSAVIAMDVAAAPSSSAIIRFVSLGGGAILAGTAARIPALAAIAPASPTSRRAPRPRSGFVLAGLKRDAEVLESAGGRPLVAARRSQHGRVIATGYDETWRWRMERDAEPAAHREWWSSLVTAVAYVPRAPQEAQGSAADAVPFAAIHAALGPPSDEDRLARSGRIEFPPQWLLFAVLLAAILGEVLSRRLRGLA